VTQATCRAHGSRELSRTRGFPKWAGIIEVTEKGVNKSLRRHGRLRDLRRMAPAQRRPVVSDVADAPFAAEFARIPIVKRHILFSRVQPRAPTRSRVDSPVIPLSGWTARERLTCGSVRFRTDDGRQDRHDSPRAVFGAEVASVPTNRSSIRCPSAEWQTGCVESTTCHFVGGLFWRFGPPRP
jgi:hypothetical protein